MFGVRMLKLKFKNQSSKEVPIEQGLFLTLYF
jgi:hypothetical protein